MEYRRLGRAGLKLSELSYGSWVTFSFQLDASAAMDCIRTAYDAGINFFDNAEVYAAGQSELLMGQALAKLGFARDSYCVSSKVYWGGDLPTQRGLHRKHVRDACHAALRRLQVDYLDLFFCHRPDLETPIEETVRAMDELVRQGKVLYWGTSEWSAEQIQQAHGTARQYGLVPPSMEQPEYNMFSRDRVEREFHRLYAEIGLGTTTWSPLASGILTGKYGDGVPAGSRMSLEQYAWLKERVLDGDSGREKLDKAARLARVAREIGMTPAQLAIAWCLENPNVSTVILGASTTAQLTENIGALDRRSALTDAVKTRIEEILDNRPELPRQY
ncbi:MAG TPA: aldo/keto reductase [Candidatus Polarisedimenticolaceae bacterium]|nr:aldo/keto reductase [Candidatus Polarisedimenticolaceae bacterium]